MDDLYSEFMFLCEKYNLEGIDDIDYVMAQLEYKGATEEEIHSVEEYYEALEDEL